MGPLPKLPRRQNLNQQSDPLPCPRCGSKNTKFCYYNNYNKSQPRHFCKACKRHWTKGGTLRNVPVGGGRKNKRLKTAATSTATSSGGVIAATQSGQRMQQLSLSLGDQKDVLGILSQASLCDRGKNVIPNFSGSSTLPLFQNQMPPFIFSTLDSLESNPISLNCDNNLLGQASLDYTIPIMPSTASSISLPMTWQTPMTTVGTSIPNYWKWDDVDTLVSADQLNINWDDTHETKS